MAFGRIPVVLIYLITEIYSLFPQILFVLQEQQGICLLRGIFSKTPEHFLFAKLDENLQSFFLLRYYNKQPIYIYSLERRSLTFLF